MNELLKINFGVIKVGIDFLTIFQLLNQKNKINVACLSIYRRILTIIQEILTLSMTGLPDGAFSRWRSLYENYIILKLLLSNNEELSDRFMKHSIISKKQLSVAFEKLNHQKPDAEFEKEYIKYVKQYGKTFKEDYGWLAEIVPERKNRTFSNICKIVDDEKILTPFYKLSCKVLHANSFSSVMYLGQNSEVVPVGPSEYGNMIPISISIFTLLNSIGIFTDFAYGRSGIGMFLIKYIEKLKQNVSVIYEGNIEF